MSLTHQARRVVARFLLSFVLPLAVPRLETRPWSEYEIEDDGSPVRYRTLALPFRLFWIEEAWAARRDGVSSDLTYGFGGLCFDDFALYDLLYD
jgi:hypothetical protein